MWSSTTNTIKHVWKANQKRTHWQQGKRKTHNFVLFDDGSSKPTFARVKMAPRNISETQKLLRLNFAQVKPLNANPSLRLDIFKCVANDGDFDAGVILLCAEWSTRRPAVIRGPARRLRWSWAKPTWSSCREPTRAQITQTRTTLLKSSFPRPTNLR